MLGNWSAQKEVILKPTQNIEVISESRTTAVILKINEKGELKPTESTREPFKDLVSKYNLEQKCVVTGLYVKFIQNDFDDKGADVRIMDLHKNDKKYDEDIIKQQITIKCAANQKGVISESDAIRYVPVLTQNEIRMFCGQEDVFFKEDATDTPLILLYKENHPFIYWLKSTGNDKAININKDKHDGILYYAISLDDVTQIQTTLKNDIFDKIVYTRFEECHIDCNLKDLNPKCDKMIVLLLQINYCIINKL